MCVCAACAHTVGKGDGWCAMYVQRPSGPTSLSHPPSLPQVTLHNLAVAHADVDPAGAFRKLSHLITTAATTSPPATAPPRTALGIAPGIACTLLMAGGGAAACQPPEAFPALLLLYLRPQHRFLDLAADVLAQYPGMVATLLTRVIQGRGRACWGEGGGLG